MINRAVFLDRDGTIIEEKEYLSDPKEVFLLPGVLKALKLIRTKKFKIVIATNQSGIERGFFSISTLNKIHKKIIKLLKTNKIKIDAIYFCPHHPDKKCLCRKPQIGIALKAKRKFNLNLKKSFAIGDRLKDVEFAKNFGGKGILLLTGYGKKELSIIKEVSIKPDYIAGNLMDAVKWLIKQN